MKKYLLFFLTIFIFVSSLKADNKILWDTVHYPPSLISEGTFKNQGYSDMSREMLMYNLKDYEHDIISGSIQKAMQDLASSQNYCFAGLSHDKEKEKFIYYSKPFIKTLPSELIIRTKDVKRFKSYIGQNSIVNLHRIHQNNGFIFGYESYRKYSKIIDRVISLNEEKKHLIKRDMSGHAGGLVKQLSEEVFDYIIEYPTIVSYTKNEIETNVEFSYFPIMDSQELKNLYVGCSKNEFGKKVIKKVNKIIDENREMFVSFYKTWLDYDSKKQYQMYINKINEGK